MIFNLKNKANDEKYFKSIRYFSHSLKGELRNSFISELSEYNIYLAAQCLMSAKKDEIFENQIIDKAVAFATEFNKTEESAKGFLALAEFESFTIISNLLKEVITPSKTHLNVFVKILAENSQQIFLSFLEVILSLNKPLFVHFILNAYNGQIVITSDNKSIIKRLINFLFSHEYFGQARVFLEKYNLLDEVGFIMDIAPSKLTNKLLSNKKTKITTVRLAYEICLKHNLFTEYTPEYLIEKCLNRYGVSNKNLIYAIEIANNHLIPNCKIIDDELLNLFQQNKKKTKNKINQLYRRGLISYLNNNETLMNQLNNFASELQDKTKTIPIIEKKISTIKLSFESCGKTLTLLEILDLYLDTSNKDKEPFELFIKKALRYYNTTLLEISHLLRNFELIGIVQNIGIYGVDVNCSITNTRKNLFLHKSQIVEREILHPSDIFSKGDPVKFRIIGINPITYRLNISCLGKFNPAFIS